MMLPKNTQAIIFDLDGTTVDTEKLWTSATLHMLVERKIVPSEEELTKLLEATRGMPTENVCETLKNMFDLTESPEALGLERTHLAYESAKGNVSFIPGFVTFFKQVQRLGLKTALVTNSEAAFVNLVNKEVHLKKFFDNRIYEPSCIDNRYKPLPDIYLYAARKLDVSPDACVAIEDSATGIASAVAAGIFCIGIDTGHNRAHLSKADLIVESYDQIPLKTVMLKKQI